MKRVIQLCLSLAFLAPVALSAGGCASSHQEMFASPDDAVNALVSAAHTDSKDQLQKIFGPDSAPLVSSGDDVADRAALANFVREFDEGHKLDPNPNGSKTLVIGNDDWPFPVPLVKDSGKWMFDTASGMDELINRRIGRNELFTIQVCLAIADAQREYAILDPDNDGVPEYAEKFFSDASLKNGLYWQTAPGETPSPLGELAAQASDEGYTRSSTGEPSPYHGYFYRMLLSQGQNAPGGALDYIISDQMIGGFGVIAYPAEYGASGIMTFMTSHSGVVYQKDLGDDTARIVTQLTTFDPDASWTPVDR